MDNLNDETNEIDQRLRQWARDTAPTEDRLQRLRQEILAQAIRINAPVPSGAGRWWQTVAGRAAIGAVTLSLLVVIVVWPRGSKEMKEVVARSPADIVSLPEAHLHKLVAEIERLFDDRLAWVAETNQDVSLGIERQASMATGQPRIAVRVVVLQRASPSDPWKAVWTGDVAARAEELVQVKSPGDGSQWMLWTHVLPDGAVSVDTELAMPGGSASWKASSVQQPQVPVQVLANRQGEAEFQVWQTASVMSEETL